MARLPFRSYISARASPKPDIHGSARHLGSVDMVAGYIWVAEAKAISFHGAAFSVVMSLRHRVRLDFSNFSDTTEVVYAEFICEKNAQIMAPTPRLFHFNSVGTSQQPILSRIAQKLELIPSDSSDQPIAAQYIWIGDSDMRLSSNSAMSDPSALPDLAPGNYREVILRAQAFFKDPLGPRNGILVLCDAYYTPAGVPIPTNKRHEADKTFSLPAVVAARPCCTTVQVYTLSVAVADPQGPYYHRIIDEARGNGIAAYLREACQYSGIDISVKAGVMPGQWEFQVGRAVGISAADHVWVARYILESIVAEKENDGVVLSLDPIQGGRNGAGSRTNFSTESMRNDGGHEAIWKAMQRFALRRKGQIWANFFGGCSGTADIDTFLWGFVASGVVGRGDIEEGGSGFLEYSGPASNMDPYVITSLLAETTILWKPYFEVAWERVRRWVVG